MTNKPTTLDQDFLHKALKVAKQAICDAETIIKGYYQQSNLATEVKQDQTPVTVADKEAERLIRKILSEHYPEHGIYGEEYGQSDQPGSDYLWLIDPIDGTKSFVRHYPFFSTQIALMYQGELVLGVSNAPMFGEMAWAVSGGGAFLNGEPISVEEKLSEHSSCVSTGNIQNLLDNNWHRLGQLLKKFSKIRGYGDFYHYHLLASGKIDLCVESDVNILDIAALTVIVREAGGVVTELNGDPINLTTQSILAGTKITHTMGLDSLNE